ncbi:uncharacterized protein [Epargyreus clarus]
MEVLRLRCSLPAGRLTLSSSRCTTIEIECEPGSGGGAGRFRCEEVQRVVAAVWAGAGGPPPWLPLLVVERCELHEPLRCVPALPGGRCADLRLSQVPNELRPEHVDGLNASYLFISYETNATSTTVVPYAALGVLPELRGLIVQNVPRLTGRWPPALGRLQKLELNGLVEVPARAFEGLSNLRSLRLGGQSIEKINEGAFENLINLEKLHLNSKALKSVPSTLLLATTQLVELELVDLQLQYLPREALRHLQFLKTITFSNENMSELSLEPETFSGFRQLRVLELIACGARAVPERLLRGSRALVTLSLKDNRLAELPAQLLSQQPALSLLVLARNRLTTLPHNLFAVARRLKELDLSENSLQFLPTDIFKNLFFLEELNLSHNKLKMLNPKLLAPLHSLEQLWAANNGLTSASLLTYLRFMSLTSVDLSHNNITQLSNFELNFIRTAVFNLEHNNISKLSLADSLANLDPKSKKASFRLNNNPFNCDCNLYNFVRALRQPHFARRFHLEDAQCAAPASLHREHLNNVSAAALSCTLGAPACPARCACALRPATARLELDCPTTPRQLPPLAPLGATAVQLRLHIVPDDLATLPSVVRLVDLSGLGLTVAPKALRPFDDLTVDLRNNNLSIAPISLLETNATIRLAGNRFDCDCGHRDSIAALKRHWKQLKDGAKILCHNGELVMGLSAARLCSMRDATVLGGTLAAVGLTLATLGALAFRYSKEIRLVLRRYEVLDFLFEEPPDPAELQQSYDAFVSFSHHDDDFVQDELVPRLEGGRRPLQLCLHYRDWEIGGMIPEQIARSVSESRRTIVVLSRQFLESNWGRAEFRAAHALDRVILLLRGDVLCAAKADPELRAYLITNTYVHADDPLVWDRVRDAVLRARRPRAPVAPALPAAPTAPTALPQIELPDSGDGSTPNAPVLAVANTAINADTAHAVNYHC